MVENGSLRQIKILPTDSTANAGTKRLGESSRVRRCAANILFRGDKSKSPLRRNSNLHLLLNLLSPKHRQRQL